MRITRLKKLCLGGALALMPFVADAGGPYQLYLITPCRIIDTRRAAGPTGGPSLTAGTARNFPISGQCGVPTTAQQVFLNVTMVGPTQQGFLNVWPYNTTEPVVSTINAAAGTWAIANGTLVTLTADPNFNVSVVYRSGVGTGTTDVLLDVVGYLQ
jgi:hypothetical protein